jgi:hypothetical protein
MLGMVLGKELFTLIPQYQFTVSLHFGPGGPVRKALICYATNHGVGRLHMTTEDEHGIDTIVPLCVGTHLVTARQGPMVYIDRVPVSTP